MDRQRGMRPASNRISTSLQMLITAVSDSCHSWICMRIWSSGCPGSAHMGLGGLRADGLEILGGSLSVESIVWSDMIEAIGEGIDPSLQFVDVERQVVTGIEFIAP